MWDSFCANDFITTIISFNCIGPFRNGEFDKLQFIFSFLFLSIGLSVVLLCAKLLLIFLLTLIFDVIFLLNICLIWRSVLPSIKRIFKYSQLPFSDNHMISTAASNRIIIQTISFQTNFWISEILWKTWTFWFTDPTTITTVRLFPFRKCPRQTLVSGTFCSSSWQLAVSRTSACWYHRTLKRIFWDHCVRVRCVI